jgi:hypothetical protein
VNFGHYFLNHKNPFMKKLSLTIAAVVLCSATLFAQISIGAKAGLNLANVSGDDVDDTDMRIGFHLGGYANIAFSEALSLQPELLYNSVGAKTTGEGITGDDEDVTFKLNYISIPVSLMYSFGAFSVHAGPQLSFLASAKTASDDDALDGNDIKDGYKSTDLGFNLGIGGNFGKLNATARYSMGLSSIDDSGFDADVKNSVIQLSLGYKLFGGE